jgi:hypothetical protein
MEQLVQLAQMGQLVPVGGWVLELEPVDLVDHGQYEQGYRLSPQMEVGRNQSFSPNQYQLGSIQTK